MPEALRPGTDTGATILMGAKAPILDGAQLSTVIVPFMRLEPPFDNLKELIEKVWDLWMENGKNRERLGELIQRFSLSEFIRHIEVDPIPQMIREPRANPYVFWREEEVPGGWKRDVAEFRKRHPA